MAKNIIYDFGMEIKQSAVVTDPATPNSGDPVRCGALTGIALADEGDGQDVATETSINFGPFIADMPVTAEAGAISLWDALYYDDAIGGVNNDSANGYFYGFAMEALAAGTETINVFHIPSPGAGTLGAGVVGAAQLAANAVIAVKIAADAVETAKIKNVNVTEAKIEVGAAGAGLSGLVAKFIAAGNVIGGIPVFHWVHVTAGANGNTDVVLTHKTKVILVIAHPTTTVAAATLQVKNGANAITDAMATPTANAVVLCASIDPAQEDIAAGGTLRVTGVGGATMPAADVFVLGFRVA